MKLNRNSWHYKVWAKSFDSYTGPPASTDLCRYCHRIFWQLVSYAILACLALAAVSGCVFLAYMLIWKALIPHFGTTLLVVGVIAAVIIAIGLYSRWLNGKRQYDQEPRTLVGQYLNAKKEKVCPLVEFDDEE